MNGAPLTLEGYETTVQTDLATAFIRRNAAGPFYLQLNYLAPHSNVNPNGPPIPHEDHVTDFDGYTVPRTGAYNEPDMSDKPQELQRPAMSATIEARIDLLAEARLETLQSVDDGMVKIHNVLTRKGILDRTNVIFVSDNGYMLGEHRIRQGKVWGYQPSVRVPLLMAGPSVPASGAVNPKPVGLHDLASTITTWYGLGPMPASDGVPLFAGPIPKRDILLQGTFENDASLSYTGLRTWDGYKYLEYGSGAVELYNLSTDPMELDNLADDPAYQPVRHALGVRLATLSVCAGPSCLRTNP